MKLLSVRAFLCVSLLLGAACKKQTTCGPILSNPKGKVLRKVQFLLYTDKNFSGDNKEIVFTAFIRNAAHQTLWDSVLPPMKIKDIPNLAHRLVIEKSVTDNNVSPLGVGFLYAIEDVGNSWHLERFETNETFKIVDFNFQ